MTNLENLKEYVLSLSIDNLFNSVPLSATELEVGEKVCDKILDKIKELERIEKYYEST